MKTLSQTGATLVLGGARSGKSLIAEKLVLGSGLKPVYIATGRALDEEMSERIAIHRDRRGDDWETVEEPLALVDALRNSAYSGRAVLVDCLSLWVTNLMMAEADVTIEAKALAGCIAQLQVPVVLVASEVGMGIVPENRMARDYVDLAGDVNQRIAQAASTVYFVAAGLPLALKTDPG